MPNIEGQATQKPRIYCPCYYGQDSRPGQSLGYNTSNASIAALTFDYVQDLRDSVSSKTKRLINAFRKYVPHRPHTASAFTRHSHASFVGWVQSYEIKTSIEQGVMNY